MALNAHGSGQEFSRNPAPPKVTPPKHPKSPIVTLLTPGEGISLLTWIFEARFDLGWLACVCLLLLAFASFCLILLGECEVFVMIDVVKF